MLPKISLLEELRKGGYDASLITTYNAYLPFYEEVVLRCLVNSGVRHNFLLMDARQYAVSLSTHPPRLAGRQYTLMPVHVQGAFHPKLIFLTGRQKAAVLVGSHNMTLTGFGFNRELTNLVRIKKSDDPGGTSLAWDAWTAIVFWVSEYSDDVPERVKGMIWRVRDLMPWIKSDAVPDANIRLLVGQPGRRPLWDQFRELITGQVQTVAIAGAFFDQKLEFLERVKGDLKPNRFAVAIDAKTVQIPLSARTAPGIEFVSADKLGASREGNGGSGYLHAKAVLVEQQDGKAILTVGSANPSAPAWLADQSGGNVEMMLVHIGDSAKRAAQALGIDQISSLRPLGESDWAAIDSNTSFQGEHPSTGYRHGLGLVENGRISIHKSVVTGSGSLEFALLALDGTESARTRHFDTVDDSIVIEFEKDVLGAAAYLNCMAAGRPVAKVLLHHALEVEEQSRSGTQRRFKEALLSLETDTPNIELLIHCIDKMVFAEERLVTKLSQPQTRGQAKSEPRQPDDPGTLAIDVDDVKTSKRKKRLIHSSDFGYLLDALIYHLKMHEDKLIEERDTRGRSEEEQIGEDDDLEGGEVKVVMAEHEELLRLCHAKVAAVVHRMISQLEAYSAGRQPLADVLVRLLAVLAVLRELRRCDGRAVWVEKGKTAVPREQRIKLLEEVMFNLFERNQLQSGASLLYLEPLEEDFYTSDDVARLKGLILWLAWDCGLTLNLRKPFNERLEDCRARQKRNAMVLALAQMVRNDEVVIDEARQSIGSLTTGEMEWLADVQQLADRCEGFGTDAEALLPAESAEPGDIAVHRSVHPWDLRIVASNSGSSISLIHLSKSRESIDYTPNHLAVARFVIG